MKQAVSLYERNLVLQGERVWDEVCNITGRCMCLSDSAVDWCCRLQRLFFLNEGQDLSRWALLLTPAYPLVPPFVSLPVKIRLSFLKAMTCEGGFPRVNHYPNLFK